MGASGWCAGGVWSCGAVRVVIHGGGGVIGVVQLRGSTDIDPNRLLRNREDRHDKTQNKIIFIRICVCALGFGCQVACVYLCAFVWVWACLNMHTGVCMRVCVCVPVNGVLCTCVCTSVCGCNCIPLCVHVCDCVGLHIVSVSECLPVHVCDCISHIR